MRFRCIAFLILPGAAVAHMVSMSTGEVKIDGRTAAYELRMPSYEAAHAKNPEQTLFEHIHFRSGGVEGRLMQKHCSDQKDNFVCTAVYEFPQPVEVLEVECAFAAVTVPNHIHLLRAYKGDKSDQAVFDVSFTTAEIRFRPPQPWEIFVKESGAGFLRAVGGLAPLLFLLGLALAARSWRELGALALSFLAGETLACLLAPQLRLYLSPRFIEAAAALTISYLAFEIVLLPGSGQRWLVVGVLGLFHGAYFSLFLDNTGYGLARFFSGVAAGELLILALLHAGLSWLLRWIKSPRAAPALAAALMAVGVAWFAIQVWS